MTGVDQATHDAVVADLARANEALAAVMSVLAGESVRPKCGAPLGEDPTFGMGHCALNAGHGTGHSRWNSTPSVRTLTEDLMFVLEPAGAKEALAGLLATAEATGEQVIAGRVETECLHLDSMLARSEEAKWGASAAVKVIRKALANQGVPEPSINGFDKCPNCSASHPTVGV